MATAAILRTNNNHHHHHHSGGLPSSSASTSSSIASSASSKNTTSTVDTLTLKQQLYLKQRKEEIDALKSNLSRYARMNDRRMVLRSLKDVKSLSYIELDTTMTTTMDTTTDNNMLTSQLEQEVSKETICMNSLLFHPKGSVSVPRKDVISMAGFHSGPTIMLRGLIDELCSTTSSSSSTSKMMYKQVLTKLSRSTGSADAYFQLNSMLGSSDLIVMQQLPKNNNNNSRDDDELHVHNDNHIITMNMYNDNKKNIHMTLDMAYDFGLYRKSDINTTNTNSSKPWIVIQGVVHERTNLTTNQSVRYMSVRLPELY